MNKKKGSKPPIPATTPSRRDVFARMRRSVVAIVKARALVAGQPFDPKQVVIAGSGFFVEANGLVVTAGHVVDLWIPAIQQANAAGTAPELPQVLSHGPTSHVGETSTWTYFLSPVSGVFRSANFDLALLRTHTMGDAERAICAVEFASTACAEGDHVASCGYPFGTELHAQVLGGVLSIIPSFSAGIVSALLPHNALPAAALKRFQIHAMISSGNSGGPVFDPRTGRVVGVVTDSLHSTIGGVTVTRAPKDEAGAPIGAPAENLVDIQLPTGLALAEHAHHARTMINEYKALEAKQAAG